MSVLLQAQAEIKQELRIFEFDPKAVEALIIKDLGLVPSETKVEFIVQPRSIGYGMSEHDVHQLVSVRVVSNKPAIPAGPIKR